MKTRIITAAVALCIFVPFVIFSDTIALIVFSTVLSLVATFEVIKCARIEKNIAVDILSAIFSIVVNLSVRTFENERAIAIMLAAFILYFIFMAAAAVFSKGKFSVTAVVLCAVMTLYISFGFASLAILRDSNSGNGFFTFFIAFAAPWICDGGAYFVGMSMGKHKLIPDVSPKKTVEGAVGGIIFGTLATVLIGYFTDCFGLHGFVLELPLLIAIGFVLCIISMIGDLSASVVKRHYDVKDYGNIFPGHGGVMDRFDSIIPTSAVMAIIVMAIDLLVKYE